MSVYLPFEQVCISALLYDLCAEFRHSDQATPNISTRIFAELCYAGVLVAALVETVVRSLFILPAFLIGLCTSEETQKMIRLWTVAAVKDSIVVGALALLALAQNPCVERLTIDDEGSISKALVDWSMEDRPRDFD